jgi:hypothetical protein
MLVLAGKAPVGEKIIRPDHHQIDALDRCDRVGMAQRFLAFKLDDKERRRVERRICRRGRKAPVVQMGQGTGRRAMPERRKFCRRDVGPRIIGRLQMRRDHAERASIEHARHYGDARHAHQRRDPRLERGDANLAGSLERETRMLQIDIEAVEARGPGDAGDLDAAYEPNRHGGNGFAAAKLLLDMVAQ